MKSIEHPEYHNNKLRWQKVRDVVEGEDAVKARGQDYLPMLSGQSVSEYDAYKERAEWYDATSRTLEGLTGEILRKPPIVREFDEDRLADITKDGIDFETYVKTLVGEILSMGRYGVLIDPLDNDPRAFMVGYAAEDIVDWQTNVMRDGTISLTMVLLFDHIEMISDTERRVYRQLYIDDAGRYVSQLMIERTDIPRMEDFPLVPFGEPIVATRRGTPLDFIPFVFFGPRSLTTTVAKPPILGLAYTNLSHYRTSADLEHGAHFTAMPTTWIAGAIVEGTELKVGAQTAWLLQEGAQVGMLEFTGQGLGFLLQLRDAKEKHMQVLGARLLEDQATHQEAFATVGLRHRGERSILANVADTVSNGCKKLLEWIAWFEGDLNEPGNSDISVEINKDFQTAKLTFAEMLNLVKAWQSSAIGSDVLFYNLQQGERLPDGMTKEEWEEDIANSSGLLGSGSFSMEETTDDEQDNQTTQESSTDTMGDIAP